MAKITHIHVGMKRKYMHPYVTYESFEIEGGLTVQLEDGETPEEAVRKSFPILREQMVSTYKEFRPKPPKKP